MVFGGWGGTAITLFETYSFSTPCGFSLRIGMLDKTLARFSNPSRPALGRTPHPQFFTAFQNCGWGGIRTLDTILLV